jgi:tripartite-type tricarboxylate transporter receptor subunit TctC
VSCRHVLAFAGQSSLAACPARQRLAVGPGQLLNQHVLVLNRRTPATTVSDLVNIARKNRDEFTFASLGIGSMGHLSSVLFAEAAGIRMTHVPYKGFSKLGVSVA